MKSLSITGVIIMVLSLALPLPGKTPAPATVKVSGSGSVRIPVEFVSIHMTMQVEDPNDPVAAKQRSDADVKEIISLAKAAGVQDKDIDASCVSIGPRRHYDSDSGEYEFVTYQVERDASVILRDVSKLDSLLTQFVGVETVTISGVEFRSDRYEEARNEAIAEAALDAKKKAAVIAKSFSMKVGSPQLIRLGEAYDDEYMGGLGGAGEASPDVLASSFLKNELVVEVSLAVRFELTQ